MTAMWSRLARDQKQHVEVTRDLAERMNRIFGPVFKVPEASILPDSAAVPGLDGQKMSKSYGNTIGLFEEEKALKKKVMSIVTDSTPVEAPKDPNNSTILNLYRLFASPAEVASMEKAFRAGGRGYGDFKKQLLAAIWDFFAPFRRRREELAADAGEVDRILRDGARRAALVADQTMHRVRAAVGLR